MSVEDAIIAKLELHRDIKELVMRELRQMGVPCQETPFTDANGDIILLNPQDIPKAQALIQTLQQRSQP